MCHTASSRRWARTAATRTLTNALAIVDGMTTDLAGRVTTVKATETESTTLVLDNGVEIVLWRGEGYSR